MKNLLKIFSFFLLAIQICFAQTIQHQHYSTATNETSLKSNKLQNQSEFDEVDSQKGPVEEVWVKHYGSRTVPSFDRASAIQIDESGNIYVTGTSRGQMSEPDYATIKYNSSGEILWAARYNGDGNGSDYPLALVVDATGNVYVTGCSLGSEGVSDYEYATIKYSPEGNELWVAHYNTQGNADHPTKNIAVDSYGNVYVTGRGAISGGCFATIKYNKDGEEQWVATYNNSFPAAMTIDDMGNVYVTGKSEGNDIYHSYDFATIKYSTEGKQLWISRYNNPWNYSDIPTDIAVDKLGNVYVTGESDSTNDPPRFTTIKYNAGGGQEWIRRNNAPESYPSAIAIDPLGNIIVTGTSPAPPNGQNEYLTIKYNTDGAELWVSRYNETANIRGEVSSLAVDSLGNIYVTGISTDTSGSYISTVKYSPSGEERWIAKYKGEGTAIAVDPSGNVFITGSSAGKDDYGDYSTIKYNTDGIMQWIEFYNGPGTSYDRATALAIDTLGNIYVTGSSLSSNGYDDYVTIKYNAVGQAEWITRYNDPKNLNDRPTSMAVDRMGNVYVTGCSDSWYSSGWFSTHEITDYSTVKYNSSGVEEWVAQYNGSGNGNDVAAAIAVDISGNVYVTGSSFSSDNTYDITTIKYNSGGDEKWNDHYKGSVDGYASAKSMAVDDSGNVYVTGTISDSSSGIITIKYNTNGIEQWISQYKGEEGSSNVASDMKIDNLGNVYVTGESWNASSDWDVYTTIKYNNEGIQQWVVNYEDSVGDYGYPIALAVDNYGNVYVTGSRWAKGTGDGNYVTLKYSTEGTLQRVSIYKGRVSGSDNRPSAIAVDGSGNVYVTGQSVDQNNYSTCYATVKYNSLGIEEWVALHSGVSAANLAIDASGYVYVTGSGNFPSNTNNIVYTTIKYVQTPMSVKDISKSIPETFQLQQNYPNPFNPTTKIKYSIPSKSLVTLKVFDILGKEIETLINEEKTSGIYEINFDASQLSSGIYFYQIKAGDFIQTKKMLLIK